MQPSIIQSVRRAKLMKPSTMLLYLKQGLSRNALVNTIHAIVYRGDLFSNLHSQEFYITSRCVNEGIVQLKKFARHDI